MRVEFRVLAYESVEIDHDEEIIKLLKSGEISDMDALLDHLGTNKSNCIYDFHQESIIQPARAGMLLDDDYILIDCESLSEAEG